MNAAALVEILAGIERADKDSFTKQEFRAFILNQVAPNLPQSEQRVLFARHLLDLRESCPVIVQRLMARYRIEQSQAYRDLQRARDFPSNGKAEWSNAK